MGDLKDGNGLNGGDGAVGFTLADGNGTTANGSMCDLGGDVIQDTILQFNPREYSLLIGDTVNSSVLYFGDVQNDGVFLFGVNDYDAAYFNGGSFEATSSSNVRLTASDNSGFYGTLTIDPYSVANEPGAGLYLRENQTDEYGFFAINNGVKKYSNIYYGVLDGNNEITDTSRWEANENEVHGRKYITVGGSYNGIHCNTSYAQLEYNKVAEDNQATGTLWVMDADGASMFKDGTKVFRIKNSVPTYADDAAAIGGGLTTGDVYKTTTGGSTFLKIVP